VSRSGYYEWKDRPTSARDEENELLLKHIHQIHDDSRGSYGSPRVHVELTLGLGLAVNEKRVARLMRAAGIRGLYVWRRRGCTVRNPAAESAGDLVNRQFVADAPNRLWVTDITERPTDKGKLYCAAVMDVRRNPTQGETILHSDHGSQYTSWAFGQRIKNAGLLGSMGSVGDCYDNATMESFWGTLQLEVLDRKNWSSRAELANAIFEWIECWYNPTRRHSSLGMLSPVDYEHLHTPSDHSR
jgi:putative transposase